MERYRAYGQEDDQPLVVGDEHFLGVDEYNNPENVQPAYVQKAVNCSFSTMNAETRGGFVCLPELGAVPFGLDWVSSPKTTNASWNCVTYGKNVFVSGGKDLTTGYPYVGVSTDGVSWTSYRLSTNVEQVAFIGFGNGTFIASTDGNRVYYSSDAITWTVSASTFSGGLKATAYGNGIWLGVVNSTSPNQFTVYRSLDNGVTWTAQPTVTAYGVCTDLDYGNGLFLLGTFSLTLGAKVLSTTDGVTLTTRATPGAVFGYVSLAFGNGYYICIDNYGAICRSSDLDSWETIQPADYGSVENRYQQIEFLNGRFCILGYVSSTGRCFFLTSISGDKWLRKNTTVPSVSNSVSAFIPQAEFMAISPDRAVLPTTGAPATTEAYYSFDVAFGNVYASSLYSDPSAIGTTWIMLLGSANVGFYANGHTSRTVSLGGYTVSEQSTIVQANNLVYVFRGDNATPLYWNGDWATSFQLVPATTLPATYNSIPNSSQATYYQNRLWVRNGKDSLAASDVLAFSDYDPLANEFNLNTGNSDYVVATFPFGLTSLVCFKNKSIQLLQQVDGALTDVIVTEITRQVGLVGINAVTSVGPDLAYVSYGNINLLTLTSTNNAMQHKTLPLSSRIRRIMNRVNWQVGYKISLGYWNNKLYVSLPLDNSLFCNAVVVYNFITESWYGEWNFSPDMNMCIQGWQVNDYLGLQRLHAITEDGRIFVTDEGQNDISGTTVAEISFELVTRAYSTNRGNNESRATSINHFQRRMFADLSTNRPQFSVSSYTDGANEESVLLTDQTYTRSQSWLFNDAAYDLTNANNDYNRPYRRDYSTGPASVQSGTGFQPEMTQDIRIPMITQRQGRLSWLQLTNTQGYLMLKSIGFENRAGQRGSTIQA